jgi:hypothetical protein
MAYSESLAERIRGVERAERFAATLPAKDGR